MLHQHTYCLLYQYKPQHDLFSNQSCYLLITMQTVSYGLFMPAGICNLRMLESQTSIS